MSKIKIMRPSSDAKQSIVILSTAKDLLLFSSIQINRFVILSAAKDLLFSDAASVGKL